MTQTLSPTPSLNAAQDEIVDISNSRKLLRSTNEFGSVVLTPRKRALARKNHNNNNNNNNDIITSTPSSTGLVSPPLSSQKSVENMRSPQLQNQKTLDDPIHIKLDEEYDPEERITLFKFPKANIYSFEEISENMEEKQGRLLGHGKFEIFQMHMKKVSYFQCGSVIYPIFPKLKILKISKNQFILPLSNPERYWRIIIESNDQSIIENLELVFKNICHFRNVYIALERDNEQESQAKETPIETRRVRQLPTSKSQASLSSITTAVACFALESDSSTFVEQISPETTPLPNHESRQSQAESDTNKQLMKEDDTESVASSLDSALENFTEEPESMLPQQYDQFLESSRYYTPSSSMQHTTIMDESRDTILLSPTFQHESTRIHSAPPTRSSRSASLYISESSWMDPNDDEQSTPKTSTPGTERYIKLNLNPNPRFIDKSKKQNKEKRIVTDSVLGKNNHRYSSYDVYNILCDEDSTKEQDSGITGFLKSLF